MSSDPTWKRDANGVEHAGHEILLAFMRDQCSEYEKSRVSQHLLTGCAPCNTLRAGLAQDSAALNHLQYMSRYLYYPELQSNQILLHAQRGEPLTSVWTGKRKRRLQAHSRQQISRRYTPKGSVRIVSLPAAFALLLIFMTAVLVLAYTAVNSGMHIAFPGQQPGSIHTDSGLDATSIAQHQVTPTNTVALTSTPSPTLSVTEGPSPTPTTTVIVVKVPALDTCPPAGYVGSYIFICGHGFKRNDKILLEVDYYGSNSLKALGPYTANKSGEFNAYWSISCKNSPVSVYAVDETQHTITAPLTNIARSGCYSPTPTATPGGHQ